MTVYANLFQIDVVNSVGEIFSVGDELVFGVDIAYQGQDLDIDDSDRCADNGVLVDITIEVNDSKVTTEAVCVPPNGNIEDDGESKTIEGSMTLKSEGVHLISISVRTKKTDEPIMSSKKAIKVE